MFLLIAAFFKDLLSLIYKYYYYDKRWLTLTFHEWDANCSQLADTTVINS